jgi:hypothetical protein
LTEAQSLLTGSITIVGKVVRRLTKGSSPRYFDVEPAVIYARAARNADEAVKVTLGLDRGRVVNASAIVDYPGLVVLPLAMYK